MLYHCAIGESGEKSDTSRLMWDTCSSMVEHPNGTWKVMGSTPIRRTQNSFLSKSTWERLNFIYFRTLKRSRDVCSKLDNYRLLFHAAIFGNYRKLLRGLSIAASIQFQVFGKWSGIFREMARYRLELEKRNFLSTRSRVSFSILPKRPRAIIWFMFAKVIKT